MLEPVARPSSLTELAYTQMREGILAGTLLSDGRLSVVALADRLGMSRSPVRSAVERLVAEGLVSLNPVGVSLVQHTHRELLDLLAVRAVLEGLSARLASANLDAGAIAELDQIHANFEQAVAGNDVRRARALDLQFHQSLMNATGNQVLVEDLTRLQARVIVGTYTIAWTPAQREAVAEHHAILEALRAGDPALAQDRSVDHMEQLMARIRAAAPQGEHGASA